MDIFKLLMNPVQRIGLSDIRNHKIIFVYIVSFSRTCKKTRFGSIKNICTKYKFKKYNDFITTLKGNRYIISAIRVTMRSFIPAFVLARVVHLIRRFKHSVNYPVPPDFIIVDDFLIVTCLKLIRTR